jgi:hypothetical protein
MQEADAALRMTPRGEDRLLHRGRRSLWRKAKSEWRRAVFPQHANESRLTFSPFKLPSTVTAISSGWNNSLADFSRSSTVTA